MLKKSVKIDHIFFNILSNEIKSADIIVKIVKSNMSVTFSFDI